MGSDGKLCYNRPGIAPDFGELSRAARRRRGHEMGKLHRFFHEYAWFLLKNILGWLLILSSFVLGPLIPGPGGIPLFLLGFALISFPGKRRLVTRILRGRQLSPGKRYRRVTWLISLAIPLILAWASLYFPAMKRGVEQRGWSPLAAGLIVYVGLVLFFLAGLSVLPRCINWILRATPRVRRKIRPTLRRIGIRLLPPRWHRPQPGLSSRIRKAGEEIIHIHESWKIRMSEAWKKLRPWLPKMIGLILVPIIFYRLLKPIHENWSKLQQHLQEIRWDLLGVACLMFVVNQYLCRIQLWQGVLHGLGWKMPQAPAARIWVKSELARYIPGGIWQLVGRAYLARPYGLPVAVCSISQTLEFTMNLLAAAIVALTTLFIAGSQVSDEARTYLFVALALLPLLLLVLVPQVFHPAFNFVLRKLGKPELERQLSSRRMLGLLALACTSQLWLGLAAWLATRSLLQIPLDHAYVVVGSYCLAWAVGVSAGFMAPAGIGFREYILSITLLKVVPPAITADMDGPTRIAFFALIALTLRLWATIAELVFAAFAMLWDWRGMRGQITSRATLF